MTISSSANLMLRIVFPASADQSVAKASSTKPRIAFIFSDYLYIRLSQQSPGYTGAFQHHLSEKSIHLGLRSTFCLHIPGVLTTISNSTHFFDISTFLDIVLSAPIVHCGLDYFTFSRRAAVWNGRCWAGYPFFAIPLAAGCIWMGVLHSIFVPFSFASISLSSQGPLRPA